MKQLALEVKLPSYATFNTFIPQGNEALVAAFKMIAEVPEQGEMLFVSGPQSSGKTHLLHALCHRVNQKQSCLYLDLADKELTPEVLQGWDHVAAICLDNLDEVSQSDKWQEAVFDLYNQRLSRADSSQASLLVTSQKSLTELALSLNDLRSRLSSGLVFQLHELDEQYLPGALFAHAEQRGLEIPKETTDYLLKRLPRDLKLLVNAIDEFDQASLEAQRKLTIPFVKSLLD